MLASQRKPDSHTYLFPSRITSYINNLHPHKHRDVYTIIEKIIAHTIPLWNASLTPFNTLPYKPLRLPYTEVLYDPGPDALHQEDNEDNEGFLDRKVEWRTMREVLQPEPWGFKPPTDPREEVDLRRDYGKRGLQVIVKLTIIHLTPENPSYEGETWHIEAQLVSHPLTLRFKLH